MELTGHGRGRVYTRTKLHPDDVLSIISGGVAVDLGLVEGRHYFLFYSWFNRRSKIAVVSAEKRLVTILERYHAVPDGVKSVTKEREKEAYDLLQNFLFARIKAKNSQGNGAA